MLFKVFVTLQLLCCNCVSDENCRFLYIKVKEVREIPSKIPLWQYL